MDNNLIDFGQLFENFLKKKVAENPDLTPHKMEHMMPKLYDEWENASCRELTGKSPKEFLYELDDPETLVELLKINSDSGNIEQILVDRIVLCKECAPFLIQAIKENRNETLGITCVEILREYENVLPTELYLDMIENHEPDEELQETIIESLKENAAIVSNEIYSRLEDADERVKTIYAEILLDAPKDDRTYNLLVELFSSGDNIPLYAQYLGQYGDERCVAMLYRALDNCKYSDFLEIKNAIERMGGLVDDEYRDFSEDATYIQIKNNGKKN